MDGPVEIDESRAVRRGSPDDLLDVFARVNAPSNPPGLQRARGAARAEIGEGAGRSRLLRLRQEGCLRLRFPRVASGPLEAVIVNTAGGLAGGDRLSTQFSVGAGASLGVVTQACERVYEALDDEAEVENAVAVAEGASLAWLPQETILFQGARLKRTLSVQATPTSRLLLCESVILGREAMGETLARGRLIDRWRIRIGERIVLADDLRLEGDLAAKIGANAALDGARAFATIVSLGNDVDIGALRSTLGDCGGASLVGGLLVARLVAPSGIELRKVLLPALKRLASQPLPRLWSL